MIVWNAGGARDRVLDTCGTGGDGAHSINLSTAAAFVVAACEIPVVKHGNRAASSRAGSADVLEALGIAHNLEPDVSARCLEELSLAFLFAPRYHPGLVRLAAVRKRLGMRTVFNLAGPLCNPASPPYQLIGTPDDATAALIAGVLSSQPHARRAAVVTGGDGLDEITLGGETIVRVVEGGRIAETRWEPSDFGLRPQPAAALVVHDARESASRIERLFESEQGPARDYVIANSAAALWIATGCTLAEGASRAKAAIDSGAASKLLSSYRRLAPAC
jgi:anthranilate phosphoribosyltransferase